MKRIKKTVAFALVLGLLIGAQALGFDYKNLKATEVSKSHPAVSLESIKSEKLNPDYVNVRNRVLQANGSQMVKVGLGANLTDVDKVSLKYQRSGSDKVLVQDTTDIKNGYITFEYKLDKDTEAGKYSLKDIELKSEDGTLLNTVDLEKLGAYYTVANEENQATAEPPAAAESAAPSKEAEAGASAEAAIPVKAVESSASAVVTFDENKTITGADIGAAIESSKKAMKDETGIASGDKSAAGNEVKAADGNVTIVLDPGHGGTESGAVSNGLVEKNLNLKIAQYAKAELETYGGVTVGMTRTTDTNVDLEERTIKAGAQGADILVSLHNNSSGYGTMYGAEVFVSVLAAYHDSSAALGNLVLSQLQELGLYNRGVKERASETGTVFTLTGELADYYAVIKYSAYRGFPGIIVEHAFMDNASDAQKYLSSDAKLKELGVADATALAQYYGLKKKVSDGSITYGKLPTTSAAFANLSTVTDGNKSTLSFTDDYPAGSGLQYVQMDLGADYDLSDIKLWHYYADGRIYRDVAVLASNDPAFAAGVTTLYSNDRDNSAGRGTGTSSEYAETSAGLDIPVSKVTARYVRFYSNGSNMNSNNHYVEAAVYGTKRIHPVSVTLSKAADTIMVGGTDTLTASVLPADATDKSVTWSSSAPGVAAVSQSGLVTGVGAGTATITATAADGSLKASCAVTVKAVTSNLSAGKLFASKAFNNLSVMTDGSRNTNSYADDYPNYSGLQYVQADLGAYYDLSEIKLWHYYGDGRKYRDVIVQVSNDPAFASEVTTVYNNDKDNSAGRGTGTSGEYAETSTGLDININTVNARYVRFYSNGSNMNSNNHYVEAEVYGAKGAAVHPSTVSLSKSSLTLKAGGTDTLTASVLPLNTTDKSMTWSSSEPAVAAVSQSGLVTGVSGGTAKITATTKDGSLTVSCAVTVQAAQATGNLAAGKLPASSAFTNLSAVTDGSKNTSSYADDYPKYSGLQYMQMDLGASYTLNQIKLWHYFGDGRKYKDVIVQVSNDPAFATGVTTLFNNDTNNSAGRGMGTDNEYSETSAGKDITLSGVNARYVRFYSNGNNINSNNHYVEIEVYGNPASASSNLAAGKALTSSVSFPNLSRVTDGNRSTANYVDCYPAAGLQWVQVDLGTAKSISSMSLWHYFGDKRKYHDVIIEVSNDPAFLSGVTTVYNNDTDNSAGRGKGAGSEYTETSAGLSIQFPAVSGRYVRFYSNGSTANAQNHYVEAEVYGK